MNKKYLVGVFTVLALSGCSSLLSKSDSAKDISVSGPSVLNPRSQPATVQMNDNLQPTSPAEILADVKDFQSKISDVKLQFVSVPIEIPMENIGGTTWRAQLSDKQLQMLAVSGRTIKYDANVVAKDDDGRTAVSARPVEVAIKAPDLASSKG